MVYTPKTIYCPRCGRKVATHDGRSTMNISVECRKCHKKVVFYPDSTSDRRIRKRICSGRIFQEVDLKQTAPSKITLKYITSKGTL